MNRRRVLSTLSLALAVVMFPLTPAWTQITDGSFRGSVTDASGAAVPGATVKLTDSVSQASRDARVDASGE